ncbi:MAG: hemolysin family protein [Oscillospiraceae bacterium]|nr:hemolysin family protein [Oscillospiraceae bacterium]
MDSHSAVTLLILSLLILLSAYFAATETAFSSLNRIRIKNMSENGLKRAALVLTLHDDYDKLLSTILVGNNIVNLSAASISTVLFIKHLGDIGAMASTIAITAVVIIFGEIIPKSLAKETPEKFALFSAPLLCFFILLLTPVNYSFAQMKRLLRAAFKTAPDDRAITERELLTIVEEAEQEGAINEEDKQLIHNAIEYNDLKVDDILTPRMSIVGMPNGIPAAEMAELFLETGYSRLPVYDESIDNIIGIVHLRDAFDYLIKEGTSFSGIVSPAVFVAPTTRISELFKLLQKEKCHMAIVTDEYGGTAGLVTMEDILEELVGEIWDESDEVIEEFVPYGDHSYKVICSADIDEMFDYFRLKGESEASTVGGWIMEMLGKIPEEGDTFAYENITVTVHKTEHRRALECTVSVEGEPPA